MKLDSVRELKQSLPGFLNKTFGVRAAAGRTSSLAVASAAALRREAPSYFLGVSARGKKNYRLAVRLQDRALERSELVEKIAARAKGEVDVRYVGRIRARAKPWYRSKQRPLLIGSSVGFLANGFIMAGTLGCFVRSGSSSAVYILSNNHVLADENRYPKGGSIVQQGTLDAGSPTADRVAKLTRFVRLELAQTNFVDAAISKLNSAIQADLHKLRGIGTLAGQRSSALEVGDVVHKAGRTTGVRHGRVTAFELDGLEVEYDIGIVSFDDQIEIEGAGTRSFSDSGDSGSLIVDDQMLAAALLFAGGDHGGSNGKGLTYANPIAAVLRGPQGEAPIGHHMPISLEQARAAKESAKALLAALPGVVGVGITKVRDDYALKVNLREPLPAGVSAPERIGDVPVYVEVVGKITKRG